MDRQGTFFVIGAVLLAGVLTGLVYKWQHQEIPQQREAASSLPRGQYNVLVATKDLIRGEKIRADYLQWQSWPEQALSPHFIIQGLRNKEDFSGDVARSAISAGQPITDEHVAKLGDAGYVASLLKPGMRAVSIEVDKQTGVSGFIFPGDIVDLLLTETINSADMRTKDYVSKTILRNLQVIGVDQTTTYDAKSNQAIVAKDITLQVTPKEAEIISVAKAMGILSFSLSGVVDNVTASAKNAADNKETWGNEIIAAENSSPTSVDTAGSSVTQIHGSNIQQSE